METSVKVNCNWIHAGGCELSKAIQTHITHEDIFIKPELDDIVGEERAVLLNSPSESESVCELQLKVFPRYKIESFSLVCSAAKLEIFLGPLKEYMETVYGVILSDKDEQDSNSQASGDAAPMPNSYRYDIEIEKSGVVELNLKLLTSSPELCIFGMLLQIAPNPNGITTLLPSTINLDNVQQMLNASGQKISANAEKCKMFMQMYNKTQSANQQKSSIKTDKVSQVVPILPNIIKAHIDERLEELEKKLFERLERLEKQQDEKLDNILRLLQENKK